MRDTADAGALEYWGTGVNNTAHHNCFSDMDPGILDGSWMNFLFQDDASHYLNFSSNILFEVKGQGAEEAGMIKSIGSIFENSIIADSVLSHAFNSEPYIEPAGNMVFARNIFANVSAPPYAPGDPTPPHHRALGAMAVDVPALAGYTEIAGALDPGSTVDGGPKYRCGGEQNITACAETVAGCCGNVTGCQSFALHWTPTLSEYWSELYPRRGKVNSNPAWTYFYKTKGPPIPPAPPPHPSPPHPRPGPPNPPGQPTPPPRPKKSPVDYSIGNLAKETIATSAGLMRGPLGKAYGFTNTTNPALNDPVVKLWDFNTFYGVEGHDIHQIATMGFDTNASEADPEFARGSGTAYWNRTCSDYAVGPGSHAVTALGFRPIDMSSGFGPRTLSAATLSDALRVDGSHGHKIQAERYQRMQGVWREGSLGIGVGASSKSLSYAFAPTAWARYDGLDLDCPAPCRFQMRVATRSATGTQLRVSLDAPAEDAAAALVSVQVNATTTNWTVVEAAVPTPVHGNATTLFLRINGTCRLDWFRFTSG